MAALFLSVWNHSGSNDQMQQLTEKGASSADLADPVTGARTCQSVQLMVNGHHGVLPQTWETKSAQLLQFKIN